MAKTIGIDLGTTKSCMAIMEGGKPTVISNAEGERITPSMVGFTKKGERLVGLPAKRQAVTNAENTVYSIKRFMGRKFSDAAVQNEMKLVPYKVMEAKNSDAWVRVGGKDYSPPEISAMILQKLKNDAEAYLGEKVDKAVITVPAYFNDSQRQATKDAGKIAGLEVLRIVNEPTAASLAYGLDKKRNEVIAVYDLGGGTFDISILEIGDGVFEVKATNGDTHLGGDDFDQRIISFLIEDFRKLEGVNLSKDKMALQRLKEASEKAKKELSTSMETEINLPFITSTESGPKHLTIMLTRPKLEQLTEDLIDRTIAPTKQALSDAGLKVSQIDEVVLVGGQTRMPAVQKAVQLFFGKEPHKGINPDEVVAMGAAIQAGVLGGEVKDIVLLDVTPLSLGIETLGGVFTKIIDKNTTIPTKKSQIFSTAADSQTAVTINVLQGERAMAANNHPLGRFDLIGIPPAPRGVPQIEVTFDIDANGIIHVSAKDLGTGKEQAISIKAASGLSEEEVKKMEKEAKAHENEDNEKKERIEARNNAEAIAYTAEKTLKEHGDKVDKETRDKIQSGIDSLKETLRNEKAGADEIKKKVDELNETVYQLTTKMYEQARAGKGGAEGGATSEAKKEKEKKEGDEDVVDAEYKVEDDDKDEKKK